MTIEILKSKLHRATVTDANLEYEGSISIDVELCKAAGMFNYEKVDVLNVNNGARFSTYIIPGKRGEICLNGAAARMCAKGDKVIIVTYTTIDDSKAASWKPVVVHLDDYNQIRNLNSTCNELGRCRFMNRAEFADGITAIKGKKIVIIGCGSQGLSQGLNMRDSGLDVSFALRKSAIAEKRQSWKNAIENGFVVGTYEMMLPNADIVGILAPDKMHSQVIKDAQPFIKNGATLWYSHGFNIVEEQTKIRPDITVILMAPKGPGTDVRAQYLKGYGVPDIVAVHPANDLKGNGFEIAKALAVACGGSRVGVLESSFTAEVKSDLMGEQTMLCGMLQTGSILCFNKMIEKGFDKGYASKLVQYGWKTITDTLRCGGITAMMDRLSNPAKIMAYETAEELKNILRPLYQKHMANILSGTFSRTMMQDWESGDKDLLMWREETRNTDFEQTPADSNAIAEQDYFDKGILMIAMVKAGIELAFEEMVKSGIAAESAYFESLYEVPFLANLVYSKKLYEMNKVISDTAEYGSYLFYNSCCKMLNDFMQKIDTDIIGCGIQNWNADISNEKLVFVNDAIRNHPAEITGRRIKEYMNKMAEGI